MWQVQQSPSTSDCKNLMVLILSTIISTSLSLLEFVNVNHLQQKKKNQNQPLLLTTQTCEHLLKTYSHYIHEEYTMSETIQNPQKHRSSYFPHTDTMYKDIYQNTKFSIMSIENTKHPPSYYHLLKNVITLHTKISTSIQHTQNSLPL